MSLVLESHNQAIAGVDLHRQAKSEQVDQIDQSRASDEQQWPVFTFCYQIPSLIFAPLFLFLFLILIPYLSLWKTFYIRALLNKQVAKSRDSLSAQFWQGNFKLLIVAHPRGLLQQQQALPLPHFKGNASKIGSYLYIASLPTKCFDSSTQQHETRREKIL